MTQAPPTCRHPWITYPGARVSICPQCGADKPASSLAERDAVYRGVLGATAAAGIGEADFPLSAVGTRVYGKKHTSAILVTASPELAKEVAERLNREQAGR